MTRDEWRAVRMYGGIAWPAVVAALAVSYLCGWLPL